VCSLRVVPQGVIHCVPEGSPQDASPKEVLKRVLTIMAANCDLPRVVQQGGSPRVSKNGSPKVGPQFGVHKACPQWGIPQRAPKVGSTKWGSLKVSPPWCLKRRKRKAVSLKGISQRGQQSGSSKRSVKCTLPRGIRHGWSP
jgi:hypothetical protein